MPLNFLLLSAALAAAPVEPHSNPLPAAEARGHALARQVCASCHAVERTGQSPDRRAPTFRSLSGQYVQLTLRRKLTEIAETGHYAMPAVNVDSEEVADLISYLDSLQRP